MNEPELMKTYKLDDGQGFEMKIPDNPAYTDGHFPGDPVVPGVILVDWAIRYAREAFGKLGNLQEIELLKFKSILQPGDSFQLEVSWNDTEHRLSFEFTDGEENVHASGRIRF